MTSLSIDLPTGSLELSVARRGTGQPLLFLHGGAGPDSLRPLFDYLEDFHLIVPTHPGFDGTARPSWMRTIADLASCYSALLEALGLRDVIVAGNSAGGWIAAEMATRRDALVCGIILLNAVGLEPSTSTGPIVNPLTMPPEQLVRLSFADPGKASPPSPDAAGRRLANQSMLMTYAGEPFMHDPTLAKRLSDIRVPSLVLWGRQDLIVSMEYGQEYARRIPGSRFEIIEDAGHLPQIEQPERTVQAIRAFYKSLA